MTNEFYIEMCKNELEKNTVFNQLVFNDIEEFEEENIIYFEGFKFNQPVEVKIKHDKKGHFTNFELEYRLEGNETWNWLDSWESYIN